MFSALVLPSCAASHLSGGDDITVRKMSGANIDYRLLSVRENSLVVADAKDDGKLESSFSHAEIIPFDSICKVYRGSHATVLGRFVLGSLGAGFGVAAIAIGRNHESGYGWFAALGNGFTGFSLIGLAVLSTICLVGAFVPPPLLQLHPIFPKDREVLRTISAYPEGEPETLKLVH